MGKLNCEIRQPSFLERFYTSFNSFERSKRSAELFSIKLPSSQEELPEKSMLESYRECLIPLGSKPSCQNQYTSHQGTVRIGKIMECLDTMAGACIHKQSQIIVSLFFSICNFGLVWISYSHTSDAHDPDAKSPLTIVTAFVDSISKF